MRDIPWGEAIAPELVFGLACLQVDNWAKRLLVGAAVAYIAVVVLVPFFNVFYQVGAGSAPPGLPATGGGVPRCKGGSRAFARLSLCFHRSTLLKGQLLMRRACTSSPQALAKGIVPFLEHLLDPDFLHSVSELLFASAAHAAGGTHSGRADLPREQHN